MKNVKVEFTFSWKYAGTRDSYEVITIEMTDEEYNDEQVRDDIISEHYQDWLWEQIGAYTFWDILEIED